MARYYRYKKFPVLTEESAKKIDYKNVDLLKVYLMESGRIIPSRISNTPQRYQRKLAKAVKLARFLALLPYSDQQ
jgi:small subunit ribosomal protein S18